MQFSDFQLEHRLLTKLANAGFEHPTPVQQQAVPYGLVKKDVIVSSQTGSGKTLAYLLPALNRVLKEKPLSPKDPRVLILAPTRELAKQVFINLKKLSEGLPIRLCLITGGENFNDQVKSLKRTPHFVVATPGRLCDHLSHKTLFLDGLEGLVLDEADRMLDLGFGDNLATIHRAASHRKRQTSLFSATLEGVELNHFVNLLLKEPKLIQINQSYDTHQDITQAFYFADDLAHKEKLLNALINVDETRQVIIFTATRDDTQRLADLLSEQGFLTLALSAELTQGKRNQVMQDFSSNRYQVLVTTDLGSRGLDIPNIELVINFDMPKTTDEYVHRVGRTGRAGQKGRAISLVGPKDWKTFYSLRGLIADEIAMSSIDGLEASFSGFAIKQTAPKGIAQLKTKAAKKPVRKTVKRINTYAGTDVGDAPVIKRPKPAGD